jgi:hypothetical protein
MVDVGIFEKRGDDRPGHAEYVLTAQGYDLQPVLIALTEWGVRWAAPNGRPLTYEHAGLRWACRAAGNLQAMRGEAQGHSGASPARAVVP